MRRLAGSARTLSVVVIRYPILGGLLRFHALLAANENKQTSARSLPARSLTIGRPCSNLHPKRQAIGVVSVLRMDARRAISVGVVPKRRRKEVANRAVLVNPYRRAIVWTEAPDVPEASSARAKSSRIECSIPNGVAPRKRLNTAFNVRKLHPAAAATCVIRIGCAL